MTDYRDRPRNRGEVGSRRTTPQSGRTVRSRDSLPAAIPLRNRPATNRPAATDRRRTQRERVRRPMTLSEAALWGAGAAVIGAFMSLLYFQNWLIAGVVLIIVIAALVRVRR